MRNGDLCDPALGLTTQCKLTVPAPAMRCGVPAKSAILGALAAAHILVRCPVFGVGRFHGVCYSAYVKTSRSCHTASWAGVGERTGEGTVLACILACIGRRHISCAPSCIGGRFTKFDGGASWGRFLLASGDGTFHVHRLVSGVALRHGDGSFVSNVYYETDRKTREPSPRLRYSNLGFLTMNHEL